MLIIQYFRKGAVKSAKREESMVSMATQTQSTCRHLSTALRNYCVEDKDWQTGDGEGRGGERKQAHQVNLQLKYKTDPQCIIPAQSYIQGSLRCYYGDDNENVKKAIGWITQNNNFARASRSFVHFFAVTAQLRLEWPNFTFYRQLEHTTPNFFFSL